MLNIVYRATPLVLLASAVAVAQVTAPGQAYTDFALQACEKAEANLGQFVAVAEVVAQRHAAGGLIGPIYNNGVWPGQGPQYELHGRSGAMVNIGFDRGWKKDRTDAEQAMDVAYIGFQRQPDDKDLELMQQAKAKAQYIVAFGPKSLPELAEHVKLADAWFDTGLGLDQRNALVTTINAWVFHAELVAALTRLGHTPPMWKAYLYKDAHEWQDRYFLKKQFHDDGIALSPIEAGVLSKAFLGEIRALVRTFAQSQMPSVAKAADLIADEHKQGRRTVVAIKGHTLYRTAGEYEDKAWVLPHGLHQNLDGEVINYARGTPDEALVLRIDYTGFDYGEWLVFTAKRQRVIHVSSPNDRQERPELESPGHGRLLEIDMGYAFGDACVEIPGYPFRVFAPSGVMQLVAYGVINAEVMSRIAAP